MKGGDINSQVAFVKNINVKFMLTSPVASNL